MRKAAMQRILQQHNDTINALSQRVADLEQRGVIQTSRPLTKAEISNWSAVSGYYQSMEHTDTFILKDVIQLLLDHFGLKLNKTPIKTELKAKT